MEKLQAKLRLAEYDQRIQSKPGKSTKRIFREYL